MAVRESGAGEQILSSKQSLLFGEPKTDPYNLIGAKTNDWHVIVREPSTVCLLKQDRYIIIILYDRHILVV